jgi:hypothetical protein
VVVEEADRIKISMKKMKRWVIVSGAARVWTLGRGKIFIAFEMQAAKARGI